MRQQEFLFELVHNLTKSEKRYFKLLSNRSAGDKTYLSLFENIEQQSIYEEDILLKKQKTSRKTFAVAKNYLQEQILRSLRNFHEGISVKTRIHALLVNVEILFQKGLTRPAFKELKKARNLAIKHEKFGLLQEILNWERQFSIISEKPLRTNKDIAAEEANILDKQRNVLQYQSLYHQLLEFKKQLGYARNKKDENKVKKIINHELLKDVNKALSERARYYFHLSYTNYCYIIGNFEDYYQSSLNILKLDHSAIDEYEQLSAVLNHIPCAFFVGRAAECLQYIDLAEKVKNKISIGKFEYIGMQVFYYRTTYKIAALVKQGSFDQVAEALAYAEKAYRKYERMLNKEWKGIMLEIIALTYFLMEKPKKTFYWTNQFLISSNRNSRLDIYVSLRILNLLALIELQDFQTLGYAANSAYRSLRMLNKPDNSYEVELELVRRIKKIPGIDGLHDFKAWAQSLEAAIHGILKKVSNHESNEYEHILKWLKSKIEGTSLIDIMKANATALGPLVNNQTG